jgi:hypothetical protein
MKIIIISTEVIFKSTKDKLKILQAEKMKNNNDNEENLFEKYKRNLQFLSSTSSNSVNNNPLIIQKDFKAKKMNQEKAKICNRKTCKIPYGECVDEKTCKCREPYANLDFLLLENEDINNKNKINSSVDKVQTISYNKYNNNNNNNSFIFTINNNNNYNNNLNSANNFNINYNNSNFYCRYKRKSQLIAFALEAILMAGIGHFYLNRLLHGFVKFTLFFILALIYFLVKRENMDVKFFTIEEQNKSLKILLLNILLVLLVTGLLALQVYDLLMFGTNSFPDGFGVPLISWNKGVGDLFLFDYKNQNYLDI